MTRRLVVVTGASSGIGAALARLYGRHGDHVVLLARDEARLAGVADEVRAAGGEATALPVDLADAGGTEAVAARILAHLGPPDILVNNAGAGDWKPLRETTPAQARAMMAVPYFAAFALTRALLPSMTARGAGRIAFVTSPASFLAWPNAGGYIAARHALKGLAEALRIELRGTGLGVTLVVLGAVETPYWTHNAGRRHLPRSPRSMPTLTAEQAANAIVDAVDRRRRTAFRPALLRAVVLLHALAPRLVEARLRAAAKASRHMGEPASQSEGVMEGDERAAAGEDAGAKIAAGGEIDRGSQAERGKPDP